jgi:hypothetical protein
LFAVVVDDGGCLKNIIRIHPHVQGGWVTVREATAGRVQLVAAYTKVEKHSIQLSAVEVKNLANFVKAALYHLSLLAKFSEAISGNFHRCGISIDP